jgi:hypothetical protein
MRQEQLYAPALLDILLFYIWALALASILKKTQYLIKMEHITKYYNIIYCTTVETQYNHLYYSP